MILNVKGRNNIFKNKLSNIFCIIYIQLYIGKQAHDIITKSAEFKLVI